MRVMALMLAAMLTMSGITVFAAENESTEAVTETQTEAQSETQTETQLETETQTKSNNKNESETETVSGNATNDVSGNTTDNVKVTSTEEQETETIESTTSSMNANVVKDESAAVKTGEFNMIPIIIGLAVIAAGAGIGYVIYRKRQK